MSSSVRVVARFIIRSDKVDEAKSLLSAAIEPTRKENGCTSYQLLQNAADPTDFTFVEEWASDAALDAHMKAPHIAAVIGKLPDLVSAAPDIRRYRLVK